MFRHCFIYRVSVSTNQEVVGNHFYCLETLTCFMHPSLPHLGCRADAKWHPQPSESANVGVKGGIVTGNVTEFYLPETTFGIQYSEHFSVGKSRSRILNCRQWAVSNGQLAMVNGQNAIKIVLFKSLGSKKIRTDPSFLRIA